LYLVDEASTLNRSSLIFKLPCTYLVGELFDSYEDCANMCTDFVMMFSGNFHGTLRLCSVFSVSTV
jgi:hypothetical protein